MDIIKSLESIIKQNEKGYQQLFVNFETRPNSKNFITFSSAFTKLASYYTNLPLSASECKNKKLFLHMYSWTHLELARAYFIFKFVNKFKEESVEIINQLFDLGEITELTALYKSLTLLPNAEKFLFKATEGVRSNITPIFNSIALNNPYPMHFFNQDAWNQMILKVFFIEENIDQVIGLKERANRTLSDMLINFINERKSAKRSINPDIWKVIDLCTSKNGQY